MSNNRAATEQRTTPTPATAATPGAAPRKKKLSLDISEIDVVLERKISP